MRAFLICSALAVAGAFYGAPAAGQARPAQPAPVAAAPAAVQEISLPAKGQQLLPLPGTPTRIAVGDPDVADVKILPAAAGRPAAVMLIGKQAGTTQVQVWARDSRTPMTWTVRVIGAVPAELARRGQAGGAEVDVAGSHALVSGQASSALSHQNSVAAAAATVGKDKVIDVATAGTGGVVQVEVKVVELSRSVMKQVGLSMAGSAGGWGFGARTSPDGFSIPGSLAGRGLLSDGFNLLFDSNNFGATLRLLQTNGMARILAEPTLVALSGQSASFLAGGEIPIPESGGLGTQNVVFKPFGIGLTVTPTVLSRDRIALKVAPEASELDYVNGIPILNGETATLIPALRTRRADTMVELGDGESFIISGLVSRQTKASVNKVPFLGELPIIGAFFRGIEYSQEERELVIVVTPRLVRPIARGVALPLPGDRQERPDSLTNAWGYYLMGPAGGQQVPGFSR
ncbi:type II and III secretion system protein family protein [Bordetella sp. BOR01]|uniref:type II and III secretion system protein family protein n=1 Tax=Bordetella sp. BOR01 TaxID=2854779 RepID=UPI0021031BF9|nr:pilus assembly protein N-terminal domain-containing protein [Bordetella sp. BOR01]